MIKGDIVILTREDISGDIDMHNWVFQIKNEYIADCKNAAIVYYLDNNGYHLLKDKYGIYKTKQVK